VERSEAVEQLQRLIGTDLRRRAEDYGITVFKDGKKNKGWAGHVIERYLGLPINSSREPNFGSWELKVFPLRDRNGILSVKETIAITMLDPHEVAAKLFEDSHLFRKLSKLLIVSRIFESTLDERSIVFSLGEFDLTDPGIYRSVQDDYNLIRSTIINKGFGSLSGRIGQVIQPRTKGPGHGSTSRAFYARTKFVHEIAGLSKVDMSYWSKGHDGTWSYAPP
jgi:DNA mismatch repair protein MutH